MLRLLLVASLLSPVPLLQEPTPDGLRFGDKVDVERVVLDARVLDWNGRPVRGLGPSDFRLKIDGKLVPLESAFWVSQGKDAPTVEVGPQAPEAPLPELPGGRRIVIFFHKELEPSRMAGLLRMGKEAARLVDTLASDDQVAVVSFEWHLRMWQGFTSDRQVARQAIADAIMSREHPGGPDLQGLYVDAAWAKDAGSVEEGLWVMAEALKAVPGPKSLILFGGELGRVGGPIVFMPPEYENARQALAAARVTVYAIDITEAEKHSLQAGLMQVAADTGGFYASGYNFTRQAMDKLESALAGYYVLAFEKPNGKPGGHTIEISTPGRKADVMTRPSYVD